MSSGKYIYVNTRALPHFYLCWTLHLWVELSLSWKHINYEAVIVSTGVVMWDDGEISS